ncbi:MAG TPA: hypothetical protein VGN26_15585 [Armatimonadota bacterium]
MAKPEGDKAPAVGEAAVGGGQEAEGAYAKPPSVEITAGPKGISIFALMADAAELFTQLGAQTSTPIVVDDTVVRKITVNLTDRRVEDIINTIVATYGLAARQDSATGVWMISEGIPKGPSSYLLSDIDAITTKYVLAPNAKSLLPVFLQDHVKINQEQNAVILSAPTEVLRKFRQDISQFDVPAAQIMIEALMVEVSDSDLKDVGVSLGYSNARRGVSTNADLGTVDFKGIATLPNEFSVRLKALVEAGKARVRANPRIATVSGQEANVFVGRQRFLSTPVEVGDGGGGGRQINFVDAGIRLILTPYTGGKGEIIADVDLEIGVFGALDSVTRLPEKTTRRAQTTVRVNDGETIIIGGLNQNEERTLRSKIPILGDLPLLGGLFRHTTKRVDQTELVIFITPHLLSTTGHTSPEEEKRLKDRFLGSDIQVEPTTQ